MSRRYDPARWGGDVVAAGCLVLGALAIFQMLARHPTDWLTGSQRQGNNDFTFHFVATQSVARSSLERFREYPLWNAQSATGGPWCGNPQSAAWYAPNWILLAVDAGPGLGWLMVGHQWWCALGVYFLCRSCKFSFPSALAGGVSSLGSPFLIALIGEGQYSQLCVIAWTPWTMLAYERFRNSPRHGLTWLVLPLAMSILAGHIQEAYYTVLAVSAFAVADAAIGWRRRGLKSAATYLGAWGLVGVLTALLAAAEIIPTWIYAQDSIRAGRFPISDPTQAGAGLANLWQLLYGGALGGPESYCGPGEYYWANLCYFGLVPLALALIGMFRLGRRYPLRRYGWLGAISFCFAFGSGSPVFAFCASVVPGITLFRGPGRAIFLCVIAVSVLAAAGVEGLRGHSHRNPQTTEDPHLGESRGVGCPRGMAVAVFVLLMVVMVGLAGSFSPARITSDLSAAGRDATPEPLWKTGLTNALGRWQTWGWLAAVCGLLGLGSRGARARQSQIAGLLVLTGFELGAHANEVLRTVPPRAVRRSSPILRMFDTQTPFARVLAQQWLLTDREALEGRRFKVNTYEPVVLLPYFAAMYALNGHRDPYSLILGFEPFELAQLRHPIADLLGIRYAVVGPMASEPPAPWRLIGAGRIPPPVAPRGQAPRELPYRVYENPTFLPRTYVVGKVRIAPTHADQLRALATLAPRGEVLLPKDVLPPGKRADFQPATIAVYRPNRIVVEVTLDRPGYLVLADTWYPGWEAEDNDRPTVILQANCVGRAVPLSPGRHRVVFRYRAAGLEIGVWISVLTACFIAARTLIARWRRSAPEVERPANRPLDSAAGRQPNSEPDALILSENQASVAERERNGAR